MSDGPATLPQPPTVSPSTAGDPSRFRPARWINAAITGVLAAVITVVGIAAIPAIGRIVGLGPRAGTPGAFPPPVRRTPQVISPHRAPFVHDDDDAPPTRPPSMFGAPDDDDDEPGSLGLRGGVTVRTVPLRDRRTGTIISEVPAGQAVDVMHEEGAWVLVVSKSDDGVLTGWAKKEELLLR